MSKTSNLTIKATPWLKDQIDRIYYGFRIDKRFDIFLTIRPRKSEGRMGFAQLMYKGLPVLDISEDRK